MIEQSNRFDRRAFSVRLHHLHRIPFDAKTSPLAGEPRGGSRRSATTLLVGATRSRRRCFARRSVHRHKVARCAGGTRAVACRIAESTGRAGCGGTSPASPAPACGDASSRSYDELGGRASTCCSAAHHGGHRVLLFRRGVGRRGTMPIRLGFIRWRRVMSSAAASERSRLSVSLQPRGDVHARPGNVDDPTFDVWPDSSAGRQHGVRTSARARCATARPPVRRVIERGHTPVIIWRSTATCVRSGGGFPLSKSVSPPLPYDSDVHTRRRERSANTGAYALARLPQVLDASSRAGDALKGAHLARTSIRTAPDALRGAGGLGLSAVTACSS